MKRLLKRSLSAFLALVMALGCMGMTAFAAEISGSWTYTAADGGSAWIVSSYNGNGGSEVIRAKFSGKNIVAIGADVAKGETGIKTLTIGKNIASIGAGAFSGCTNLEKVYIEGIAATLTVDATAFADTGAIVDGERIFYYEFAKSSYATKALAEEELASAFNGSAGKWEWGTEANKENVNVAKWINGDAYTIVTGEADFVTDNTAPSASISVGKVADGKFTAEKKWNAENSISDVYFNSNDVAAVIEAEDSESGIKSVEYICNTDKITNPAHENITSWVALDKNSDGDYVLNASEIAGKIIYIRVTDKAVNKDGEANVTYINSDRINIDTELPTGSLTPDPDAEKDTNGNYKSAVDLLVAAKDNENGSGIKSVGYKTVEKENAITDFSKVTDWAETANDKKITVAGNGKTYITYLRVEDNAGNVAYVQSAEIKPADGVAPEIKVEYYNDKGELISKTLKNGEQLPVKATEAIKAAAIKISATDDVELKTFEIYRNKSTEATTKKLTDAAGYALSKDGTYTIKAADATAAVEVKVIFDADAEIDDSDITITSKIVDKDGNLVDSTVEAKTANEYSYPATVKLVDNGAFISASYSYTEIIEKDGQKEEKAHEVDVTKTIKNGVTLEDYYTYTFKIVESTFKEITFTVTISESAHKLTALTVDTGNAADKSQLTCLGGTFKATATGTDIYHKIAMFNGDKMVGKVITIGSDEKPMSTVEIAEGTFELPVNTTDKAVEYIIRYYDADTEDKDITSKTGTQISKVTVAAYSKTILVDPAELVYTAAGSAQKLNIHSNCQLSVAINAVSGGNGWLTVALDGNPVVNEDKTISTVLSVTAAKNTGLDREAVITISALDDAKVFVKVTVKQAGVGEAERLAGDDRITTAIEISKFGWDKAETVILASGEKFADALAGVPLSEAADAPILLTRNKATGLEKAVVDEIQRLGAKKVYILGGTSAVCADTANALTKSGLTVKRLEGADRYATSVAIAKELASLTGKSFTKLYFTNAWNYPDALSISAAAAIEGSPILYMPTTGAVENNVSTYVKSLSCKTGVILGGTAAVSEAGEKSLKDIGLTVTRIKGEDRYETSVKINESCKALFTGSAVAVATGIDFPDALAGGALCAKLRIPVVLVSEKDNTDALTYIKAKAPESMIIFGGTSAVSEALAVILAAAV